jgi:hypothetical protein
MRPWVLIALALCGCAGLDAEACRRADWYDLGFRDAIFGLQPQDPIYARQCGTIDAARYLQGWREGKWEADARVPGSVD